MLAFYPVSVLLFLGIIASFSLRNISTISGGCVLNFDHFNLQNIEEGKTYNLVMHIRSMEPVELTASLTCLDGLQNVASADIVYISSLMR
jgi:hypothetical protein